MTENLSVPPDAKIVLPPHGFVHLQASCASDLDVVNAARVSFAKRSEWVVEAKDGVLVGSSSASVENFRPLHAIYRLGEDDEKVLRFLLKNRHGTPFEHTFFKFHVRAPIFVFREWHRHRIGVSINEESARYAMLADDFYVPEDDALRQQIGKPGRYTYEPIEADKREFVQKTLEASYEFAFIAYEDLLEIGVAKEIARAVLPVGIYSQMIWSCNARSLMHFLSLRNNAQAMREIRLYAEAIEAVFAEAMPVTHDAFVAGGRVAP